MNHNINMSDNNTVDTSTNGFLPVTHEDMEIRGWAAVDFVLVTGDAYVDHPSFGASIISRVLEREGFKVAILAQPDLTKKDEFLRFGNPNIGFFVTSGNIDSMVSNYSAAKNRRKEDTYSPGGKCGNRPDRAVLVYCAGIRKLCGNIPIVIGGLEASLRRFAHYDYWDDKIRPSILIESRADLLVYGMGEKQTAEIANRLNQGENIKSITDINGTCYTVDVKDTPLYGVECPSLKNVLKSKKEYAISCKIQHDENDYVRNKTVKQRHDDKMLIQNPPMPPLTTDELDQVYSLPYKRTFHPSYITLGGVPAIEEVEFSITHNRGCFGDCNFCSLAFHQGRFISCRSKESIVSEAEILRDKENFKGYIHDIGGPTANFRNNSCELQKTKGMCINKKCLAPKPCPNLRADHTEYLDILRAVRSLSGIKKVFIRSGIRYDFMLQDKDNSFFEELVSHHVSGQLKVAPEHCAAAVLDYMGKPHIETYLRFSKQFYELCRKNNKEQYLVPYLISSHPGSTLKDAIELALFLKKEKIRPEQVQDFYPTPGTISTCMYYTGLDPFTLKEVYVARESHEKAIQRALLQYYKPNNKRLVSEALSIAGRKDLIGFNEKCLIQPEKNTQPIRLKDMKRVDSYGKRQVKKK
jgi:uncharacterized radical SAM protein YgiQ